MLLDALSCRTASSGHFAANIHSRADLNQAGIARHPDKPFTSAI